jgi:hypothetical protein
LIQMVNLEQLVNEMLRPDRQDLHSYEGNYVRATFVTHNLLDPNAVTLINKGE